MPSTPNARDWRLPSDYPEEDPLVPSADVEAAPREGSGLFPRGRIDARSIVVAMGAGAGFFLLASLCLALSRFDAALASLWLPNAVSLAVLLLARLRNELPFVAAIALGSIGANMLAGNPLGVSLVFTAANVSEVMLVAILLRKAGAAPPQMDDLGELGRFLQYGGVLGPMASAAIAATVLAPGSATPLNDVFSWFLADSMGMILIVPAVLLIADAVRAGASAKGRDLAERSALVLGGLMATYFVFWQDVYPLLFVVPPVTLLIAFRIGGLGTALFVPGVAVVATWMTYVGFGPVIQNHTSDASKLLVLQSFVAANFLTGLPVVAIIKGRDRLTRELSEGRSELALLADNVTDAVIQLNNEGIMTYASPSVREVLGRDPAGMIGRSASRSTHEDSSDRIAAAIARLSNGECEKERFTYRRLLDSEDGTPVFIEADCAVARNLESGERQGIIVSARDVTERVELELLLTRARRHAENAARAKSEFLANMSHEIRTPMNGVLGFAELILQDDLSPEHRRHTEMIVQSGRSMMLLLNDILDLSKIEAGQITIDEGPVDLHATLSECAALHRATAEKKGLKLDFSCEGIAHRVRSGSSAGASAGSSAERPWIITDALRLRQIVLNLVGNAVKFTEVGGVAVRYRADKTQIEVEVSDTGIGISPSRIESIFTPFIQGESDTARRFGGTGLGLTISRQLAELLGGTIAVESRPGEGSTFRLTLPATYADPEDSSASEAERIDPEDIPQSARILLVEDHDVNRLLGTEMLERCGQSVAIAHDGNEAIAMVIDSVMRGRPYDLVLMDIQMPGCDGYAATRAIRGEGIGPDTMPIVALTANAFPEDIAAAHEAGMQAHLAKPLVFADLARALQRWLPVRIVENEPESSEQQASGSSEPGRPSAPAERDRSGFGPRRDDRAMSHHREAPPAPRPEPPRSQEPPANTSPSPAQGLTHSPELLARWTERRAEAVEAVRAALEDGSLGEDAPDAGAELAKIVHKLAGTAAMFGEAELGDQAAAFERALSMQLEPEVREALAFKLLNTADNPVDRRSTAGR